MLSHIINNMFLTGMFADNLKTVKVSPIHEDRGRNNLKNYRPISVLRLVSKIFEGDISRRRKKFFNKRNDITQSLYGFLLDFENAFDAVQHDLFII